MNRIIQLAVNVALLFYAAVSQAALAPDGITLRHILNGDNVASGFGLDVDVSGHLAIVGAPSSAGGGSAFIFDLRTGGLVHKLTPSAASGRFGHSVAIDGGLAIVGSGQRNAAHVFDTTTGALLRRITPTSNSNEFVRAVDISNGIAVIGVPLIQSQPGTISQVGAAFMYDARTGAQLSRVDGPSFRRNFANRVAIEGDTVAVLSEGQSGVGDVYVLDASTGALRWRFGESTTGGRLYLQDVKIDGGRVVLGGDTSFSTDIPRAYVLDGTTGSLLNEINISVPLEGDGFRHQIDVSGNRLVVGAFGTSQFAAHTSGAAHLFNLNTGALLGSMANPTPFNGDAFGFAVALDGNRLVVGAPDDGGRGTAYSFQVVPEPTTVVLSTMAVVAAFRRRSRTDRSRSQRWRPTQSSRHRTWSPTK
jgi:outer membrane protein assembly factor BamB